jgi:hypothetical protein
MITTKLTGNLGNHISYYVSTRAIAEKLGYDWGFNPTPSYDYFNGARQMDFMEIDYGKFPENISNSFHEKELKINHFGENIDIRKEDKSIFSIKDNTELFGVFQSPFYFYDRLADVKKWLKIKQETIAETNDIASSHNISLDDNTCIINFRGGEYRHYGNLIIKSEYYYKAMEYMKDVNPKMKFIIITDDVQCANQFIPGIPAYHFSIAIDYTLINHSKYLILCNSSFPIFATLTNNNLKKVIAPAYWARWNISTGYWATSQNIYPGWEYLDRNCVLKNYEESKKDCENWLFTNGFGE